MAIPLFGINFLVESIYSVIVTLSVLFIYFKTREMYKLTEHRGIKYFSLTFMFFAIAHLFRFFFRIFFRTFMAPPGPFMPGIHPFVLGELVFTYTSVMAGLFLLYSVMWKEIKVKETVAVLLFNVIAIFTILLNFVSRSSFTHILMTMLLFAATVVSSLTKKSKKRHPFFVAYILIFLIWILDLVSIEIPRFLFELRIVIYIISASLYLLILWRILKNGKKKR